MRKKSRSKAWARAGLIVILSWFLLPVLALSQEPPPVPVGKTVAGEAVSQDLEPQSDSLWSLLLKGRAMMIPIGLCSIIAVTVIIERFVSLRRVKVMPPEFVTGLKKALQEGENKSRIGVEYCDAHPCPLGVMVREGFAKMPKGEQAVEKSMEDSGARLLNKMKRSLRPLVGIATIAPLLGLLGTVYGMITAFQAASVAGVGKGDRLAVGIYEALVTTAAGLTLAIPVLVVHIVLNGRVDSLVDDLDDRAGELIETALPAAPAAVAQEA